MLHSAAQHGVDGGRVRRRHPGQAAGSHALQCKVGTLGCMACPASACSQSWYTPVWHACTYTPVWHACTYTPVWHACTYTPVWHACIYTHVWHACTYTPVWHARIYTPVWPVRLLPLLAGMLMFMQSWLALPAHDCALEPCWSICRPHWRMRCFGRRLSALMHWLCVAQVRRCWP